MIREQGSLSQTCENDGGDKRNAMEHRAGLMRLSFGSDKPRREEAASVQTPLPPQALKLHPDAYFVLLRKPPSNHHRQACS